MAAAAGLANNHQLLGPGEVAVQAVDSLPVPTAAVAGR